MLAEYKPYSIKIKNKPFHMLRPQVMGILNTTDDSFYDGGKFHTTSLVLAQCECMLLAGANIIDIGGQSSRPGAEIVQTKLELERTLPNIEAILKRFPDTLISIDTFNSQVAKAAVEAGACMVNDISAGDDDPLMLETVANLKVPYIAMHKQGNSKTMQINPSYKEVCTDVMNYLDKKQEQCKSLGIEDVIFDPGFGFGKTLTHNYTLLKHLDLFHTLGRPLLIGISRKSMVTKLLETDVENALNGSTALHMIALIQGAHIMRVHDVKEAVECVKISEFLREV